MEWDENVGKENWRKMKKQRDREEKILRKKNKTISHTIYIIYLISSQKVVLQSTLKLANIYW